MTASTAPPPLPSFDLLDEPWIPLEHQDGRVHEVGLIAAFEHAATWRRVIDPSPLVTVALYRLLFAVFHRSVPLRTNDDHLDAWTDASAHERVPEYLRSWRSRFDLFDPIAPFWQVPDLSEEHGVMAWTKLVAELNDNNNKVLFDHTVPMSAPEATPAQVARALVACQVTSVGAGNSRTGYNVNAPVATALVVVPEGANLRDTLLANAQLAKDPERDLPVWERPPVDVATVAAWNTGKPVHERVFTGPADRLTWMTRAIRIVPPDPNRGVRSVHFGAGERPAAVEGDRDPWVAYRKGADEAWRPQRLRLGRGTWRDLHAVLTDAGAETQPAAIVSCLAALLDADRPSPRWRMLVAGQAADKAKLEAWTLERWTVPSALIAGAWGADARLNTSMKLAEEVASELSRCAYRLAGDVLAAASPDRSDVAAAAGRLPLVAVYWVELERHFAHLLEDLGTATSDAGIDAAGGEWRRAMADAIERAGEATHQVVGRDAVAIRAWARAAPTLTKLARTQRHAADPVPGGRT